MWWNPTYTSKERVIIKQFSWCWVLVAWDKISSESILCGKTNATPPVTAGNKSDVCWKLWVTQKGAPVGQTAVKDTCEVFKKD